MKKFPHFLKLSALCIISILMSAGAAFSATYYVDYVGGSDTNNGTSASTAWQHCPGDQSATGNAAALSPKAGDYIVFKGGVTYAFAAGGGNKFINIKTSGTSNGDVTYISGHAYSTPWPNASSRAVIDGANSSNIASNSNGIIGIANKSYITIKGFEMLHQPLNGDYGLIGINGVSWSHITIDDCVLHYTNGSAINVHGSWDITATPPSYLTVKDCNMYESWSHLLFLAWGIDNTLIYNNSFDRHGSDPYGKGGALANAVNISYTNDPWNTQPNSNTTIRGNTFAQTLSPATKSQILLQHRCQNLLIENNSFSGTPAVSVIDQVGPLFNYTVRNNVFNSHPSQFEGILRFFTDQGNGIYCDGVNIYNNTFVATPKFNGVLHFVRGNNGDTADIYRNVNIRNNIIDTDANDKQTIYIGPNYTGTGPVVQMSTFTCDYNAYNAGTNTSPFYYINRSYNLANWKTTTGKDANSAMGAVTFTNRAGLDFTLASGDTVAKDKGTDLTPTGFATDKLGNTRLYGTAWDIGAYEYGSGTITTPLPVPTLHP